MKDRAKDTPLENWGARLDEWKDGPYYYAHLSDAVRLAVLYKKGGVYFDTDVVIVNSMDNVKNAVAWEREDSICNAVMAFDKQNPYLHDVLRRFNDNYNKNEWGANGPELLTKIYRDKYSTGQSDSVHVLKRSAFYIIKWTDVTSAFKNQRKSEQQRDLQIIKNKSFAVHLWNSRSHDLVVYPESLVAQLYTQNCVMCNPLSARSFDAASPSKTHEASKQEQTPQEQQPVSEEPVGTTASDDVEPASNENNENNENKEQTQAATEKKPISFGEPNVIPW